MIAHADRLEKWAAFWKAWQPPLAADIAAMEAGAAALREVDELRAALAQWKHEHCENAHDKHEDCTAMCSCFGTGLSPLECAEQRIETLTGEASRLRARLEDAAAQASESLDCRYCKQVRRILTPAPAPAQGTCGECGGFGRVHADGRTMSKIARAIYKARGGDPPTDLGGDRESITKPCPSCGGGPLKSRTADCPTETPCKPLRREEESE